MKPKRITFLLFFLAVAIILTASSVLAKKNIVGEEMVIWGLTKTTVVNPGQAIVMKEGILLTGYVLEAEAGSKRGGLLPESTFRLTLDMFQPKRDMPGQKAGWWYIRGNWTLTKKDATEESKMARHSPDVIRGQLYAGLTFNPAQVRQNWTGRLTLPTSLTGGRWTKGEGSLTLNALREGDLYLDLSVWSEVQ